MIQKKCFKTCDMNNCCRLSSGYTTGWPPAFDSELPVRNTFLLGVNTPCGAATYSLGQYITDADRIGSSAAFGNIHRRDILCP